MHLACAYVSCAVTLLILSSLVTGESDITHNATKNAESDAEQNGTYSGNMSPHLENGKSELPLVIVQQLCPRGLRYWIPGRRDFLLFVVYNMCYELKFSFAKLFSKTHETALWCLLIFCVFWGEGVLNIYLYTEAMEVNCMDGGDHAVKAFYCLPKFLFPSGPNSSSKKLMLLAFLFI